MLYSSTPAIARAHERSARRERIASATARADNYPTWREMRAAYDEQWAAPAIPQMTRILRAIGADIR